MGGGNCRREDPAGAAMEGSCPHAERPTSKAAQTTARICIFGLSGNDDGVVRLKPDVLLGVLSPDHILVVEGKANFSPARLLAQNVNVLLFGEILEPAGRGKGIEHGGGGRHRI